jgi:hypothetical protein
MVMPCSLSAISPSVNKERSTKSSPLRRLELSTASSLSFVTDFVSYNNRPISVLFPSSTLPAVAIFKISI